MTSRTGLSKMAFLAVLTALIALAVAYPAKANADAPPTAPAALSALRTHNADTVSLYWSRGANYDTQFVLRREPGEDWATVATLTADAQSWTDSTVELGRKYIYKIKVQNETTGRSKTTYRKASVTLEASGRPPRDLRAANRVGGVVLTWTPGTNPGYVGQVVYRRASGEGWEDIHTTSDTSLATYTDSTAVLGQKYTYFVEADKNYGSDDRTGRVSVSGKYPPGNLTAAIQGGDVVLSWTPGSNPAYVEQIVQRRVKGEAWENIQTITNTGLATWTDTTVASGTRYLYTVRAQKANGKGGGTNRVSITVP